MTWICIVDGKTNHFNTIRIIRRLTQWNRISMESSYHYQFSHFNIWRTSEPNIGTLSLTNMMFSLLKVFSFTNYRSFTATIVTSFKKMLYITLVKLIIIDCILRFQEAVKSIKGKSIHSHLKHLRILEFQHVKHNPIHIFDQNQHYLIINHFKQYFDQLSYEDHCTAVSPQ